MIHFCRCQPRPALRGSLAEVLILFALLGLIPRESKSQESQQQEPQPNRRPLAEMSPADLAEIEITTASKEPKEVMKTPAAIYVITQDGIRRSGATSIPEVLRLAPGVEVARIDSDHWSVGIRGLGSQFSKSVLVLIDGRSVYTPLFAGVYWDVQDTLLEDIDRIEVIRGPGGTIWGANAFNGVINVITKSTKDTHGSLASIAGGNVDQGMGGFRYGGGNGKTFDYRAYGKGFTRSPEFHPDNRQFDDWRQGRLGFRMDANPDNRDVLTLQGDIYRGEDGGATSLGSFSPPSQISIYGNDALSGGNVLGRWRRDLAGGSDVQLQAYYDRTNRTAAHYKETRDTFDIDFLHHIGMYHRQDFLWGLGIRLSPSNFTSFFPAAFDVTPHRQTDSIYSGFVQDEIQIVRNKLSLTIGTKLEHNNYTGFEFQPGGRLLWTLTPRQTLWLAITRAIRTPSRLDDDLQLKDFLTTPPPIYLEVIGNPRLESERLVGYEIGYRTLITSSLYVDVSVFHDSYGNLSNYGAESVTFPTSPLQYVLATFPYVNGIAGNADGFELAPDWKPVRWWQLKASYSYINLDLKTKIGNPVLSQIPSDEGSSPRNEVSVQSLLNLPGNFEFDQTYRYVSALPGQNVKAYGTADVRLGWRPSPHFELSLVGQNLLQPSHAEFGADPGSLVGIKRSAYAKITWRR